MTNPEYFQNEHVLDIAAPAESIWRLFADVDGWKSWNEGIETIAIDGPFARGTSFRMKPPGQDELVSTLVDVEANRRFVDETRVGDLVIHVRHELQPLGERLTSVTYAIVAKGPGASEIGPMICADFPAVLRALEAKVGA
ncbi:MAG: SRPBCC family protein [Polyangiaceae bacterium]